jgi:hypothetical protein
MTSPLSNGGTHHPLAPFTAFTDAVRLSAEGALAAQRAIDAALAADDRRIIVHAFMHVVATHGAHGAAALAFVGELGKRVAS